MWFTEWLWELLDSMGVFSLGWFEALLPAGGLFGGGADIPAEESVSSVESAAAAAEQVAETAVFEDPDALFPVCHLPDFPAAASRLLLIKSLCHTRTTRS